ncbi:MAG TPA: Fur family transcriptional regulator [Mesotoga infera]|jgi:Fur family peroxide stress response transcriptional regulator|uniref:Fe2+/Zn2+ uptake regulation protein n=1 Tax=Mesotoga infera TaxID=1236046 RepID=A0A7Z7LH36_9BACT|nr:Fur family transcriptional regulator [Mesotoga infera]MBP8660310.1 transcriptional repressor [Mesotoga sp.]NLI05946.1 transcriptional repressor [Thermotogaceae bacterium]SSC13868.1 Fe2+/Zn2+ uptake regulation protein [Mesotoga infera]HNS66094.1 Fur family transcriptional regulator [Mesotoga infera]HOI34889.1 Fur family transcriptional regulator [Mesotoga infera]
MEIEETIALLKSRGYRITPQRVAILRILKDNTCHPNVEDVFRSVIKIYPNISMATVYNVMEVLEREGIVKEIAVSNVSRRYDPNVNPHGHFICRVCEKVFDVSLSNMRSLGKCIPHEFDEFAIESLEVIYRGVCKDCKDKT